MPGRFKPVHFSGHLPLVKQHDYPVFCVIGAGHGGQAMAAYLATKGFRVHLYNKTPERIAPVKARGGIELEAEGRSSFGRIPVVTTDMGEALQGADVVMVAVPASAQHSVAVRCAPHLRDDQIILLNPGRTGGALEFDAVLIELAPKCKVVVAEAQTFIFASRTVGPAQSKIFRIKNSVPVAALPATLTKRVIEVTGEAFPQFVPAPNVLKTSMDNMGAIFHPALTILNAGRIESTHGDFDYYHEGITPSVAKILEAMDRERTTVAGALGVRAISAREWLELAYGAVGSTLFEAALNNAGYKGIKAPRSLYHRYIFEDVPSSLVPISSLGWEYGVATPTIDHIIHLAGLIHDVDFWQEGRTVERLGLKGMTVAQVRQLVMEGRRRRGG
ncbi:MAG TPA: NAD(P)-binding domain-containing protein [Firmicutes bacterium]|nr:NAD(P)-binding domain-containing protein [Bacillota bacterium]